MDTDRREPRTHLLEWKVGVFTVGAGMALLGIYFEQRWLTGAAIVVLVAGALLPFRRVTDSEHGEAPGPADSEGDSESGQESK